jgi:outer membrane protein
LQPPTVGQNPSPWRLGIALGYGERSNPLIQSDDIPIVADVDIAYFGKRFFFDNGDFGLTFINNERYTLSAIARFNSDRVFFGKTNTRFIVFGLGTPEAAEFRFEVPDRDYAIELGAEVLTDGRWGRLQVAAFGDVSGTHDGFETFADYRFGMRNQRWYVEPSLTLSYKSERLNDYYWGVQPDEAGLLLPVYEAEAGLNVKARLSVSYQLTTDWSLSLGAEAERLNDEAADSPLVEDDTVYGFFAGLAYEF